MKNDPRLQYNQSANEHSHLSKEGNEVPNQHFFESIDFPIAGKTVLDAGCGDGTDVQVYLRKKAHQVNGIDASKRMIELAEKKYTNDSNARFEQGLLEAMPYADETFDVVFSKFVIQTSVDLDLIFQEVYRVLKPNGVFLYLTVHPFRQYLEQTDCDRDYFVQKEVTSTFFYGQMTVVEPTHMLSDYFSRFVLKNFTVEKVSEHFDPSVTLPKAHKVPCHMVVKLLKRG